MIKSVGAPSRAHCDGEQLWSRASFLVPRLFIYILNNWTMFEMCLCAWYLFIWDHSCCLSQPEIISCFSSVLQVFVNIFFHIFHSAYWNIFSSFFVRHFLNVICSTRSLWRQRQHTPLSACHFGWPAEVQRERESGGGRSPTGQWGI